MIPFPQVGTLVAAGGVALLAAACTFSIDLGESVTETYSVEEFDRIDISSAFDAEIRVGEEQSVEVQVSSEVLDKVEIDVTDGELRVGLGGSLIAASGPLEVVITTPSLEALEVSGASDVEVEGVDADDFELTVEGAASVEAEGRIESLSLTVDGAATVELDDVSVGDATVDIDGASNVSLSDARGVNGSIGGASNIDVPNTGTIEIDSSGVSSVNMTG